MRAYLLSLIILLIPAVTHAALVISEVAWMGSLQSANHEWIELQNNGSTDIDVTSWQLSDGMNLNISLSGLIKAGEYAVVERTSDVSAPGTAFLIYTGALVNTGATLVLKRSDGSIEDQVSGGADWKSIGGDNITKETAQLTTAGWVTGTPTPGNLNSGTAVEDIEEDNDTDTDVDTDTVANPSPAPVTTASTRSRSSGETVRLEVKDSSLVLKVDAQKVGYVNQTIDFTVKPSGIGKQLEASVQYDWNFGDGNVGSGKESQYSFSYPGTYVVTVYGSFANQKQLSRHEITILPVALTLTTSPSGDIQVNNDSPYELDISGYQVVASKTFTFPSYSILLPNQTITLPRKKIGVGTVLVKDNASIVVASQIGNVVNSLRQTTAFATTQLKKGEKKESVVPAPKTSGQFSFATENSGLIVTTTQAELAPEQVVPTIASSLALTTEKPRIPTTAWPYISLIIIVVIGLTGTALKATRNQTE